MKVIQFIILNFLIIYGLGFQSFHETESNCQGLSEQDIKINNLLKWVLQQGGKMQYMEFIEQENDERGVVASQYIPENFELIRIPQNMILDIEKVLDGEYSQYLMESGIQFRFDTYYSVFLLEQGLQKNSFFRAYIDILPKSFPFLPQQFTQEEQELLKGSLLYDDIQERNEGFKNDYQIICDIIEGFQENHSLEDFIWANLNVQSRAFNNFSQYGEHESTYWMIPGADMLNHDLSRGMNTEWNINDDQGYFSVVSTRIISKGEEIKLDYGTKPNVDLLNEYGFIIPGSQIRANSLNVQYQFNDEDPLYGQKMECMEDLYLEPALFYIDDKFKSKDSKKFISFMRLIMLDDEEMIQNACQEDEENYNEDEETYIDPLVTQFISHENEKLVWEKIKGLMVEKQRNYTNTLEENIEQLKKEDLSLNLKNIYQVIIQEQQVLQRILQFSEQILEGL